jgi:hypothetical protein
LQIVNRSAHAEKCAQESGERAYFRNVTNPENSIAIVAARGATAPAATV